jgi:hypothetical protein
VITYHTFISTLGMFFVIFLFFVCVDLLLGITTALSQRGLTEERNIPFWCNINPTRNSLRECYS